jgi:hypothetical protein
MSIRFTSERPRPRLEHPVGENEWVIWDTEDVPAEVTAAFDQAIEETVAKNREVLAGMGLIVPEGADSLESEACN